MDLYYCQWCNAVYAFDTCQIKKHNHVLPENRTCSSCNTDNAFLSIYLDSNEPSK
jgi:hypothetical protein